MNWNKLEKHFSTERMGRYRAKRDGDVIKAANDYSSNLLLAEAMFPMLNILEIALRNGVHARLTKLYHQEDWWERWVDTRLFSYQNRAVNDAKNKLRKRHENQTPDKLIAELTFGFWCSLFNADFQNTLWKDLRLIFANCPRQTRQRNKISPALNQIRSLRNRTFHHEPLLWLTPSLLEQHATGLMIINWIDPQLRQWLGNHDRLSVIWAEWQRS